VPDKPNVRVSRQASARTIRCPRAISPAAAVAGTRSQHALYIAMPAAAASLGPGI